MITTFSVINFLLVISCFCMHS